MANAPKLPAWLTILCFLSSSPSCRITAQRPMLPPSLVVVPRNSLLGLSVFTLSSCRPCPYACCLLLHCCHCVCNFHLLLIPVVAAPSLVCWRVHATTSCCTPLLAGWLLHLSALIIIIVLSSNGAPCPPLPQHPPLLTPHPTHLMALTAIPSLIPSNCISSPSSLSRICLLQLVVV
jgi:hypothetical protein